MASKVEKKRTSAATNLIGASILPQRHVNLAYTFVAQLVVVLA